MTLLDFRLTESNTIPLDSLAFHVGDTPLLPLRRVTLGLSPRVKVFAKAEWFNPGGSVKDRPALNIIQTAIINGDLSNGKRLLDSTSGNMGISYATFGAALGIPVILALPANASPERISILKVLGAELVLTDPTEGSDGAILKADGIGGENLDRPVPRIDQRREIVTEPVRIGSNHASPIGTGMSKGCAGSATGVSSRS